MNKHTVVVSVSYGDCSTDVYTQSTHLIAYDEAQLTEHESQALAELIIKVILAIRKEGEQVLGIYKQENSSTDARH